MHSVLGLRPLIDGISYVSTKNFSTQKNDVSTNRFVFIVTGYYIVVRLTCLHALDPECTLSVGIGLVNQGTREDTNKLARKSD